MFASPKQHPPLRLGYPQGMFALALWAAFTYVSEQGMETAQASNITKANVTAVGVSGSPSAYQFTVTVSSPDKGCNQYADWWEVLTEDGKLIYRRMLLHSHVDEQPFTRSGGPVAIGPDTVAWVRAHMRPGGYGGKATKGTAKSGFKEAPLSADFARGLQKQPPLPTGCAF